MTNFRPALEAATGRLQDCRCCESHQLMENHRGVPPVRTIGQLFRDEPLNWGLRGDPNLWRELASELADTALPNSTAVLSQILTDAFRTLTGCDLATTPIERFYIERLDSGGMSGGLVNVPFWKEEAFPLLCRRFEMATSSNGRQ